MKNIVKSIERGGIYYADLRPVIGSEQGGIHPVLIVQNGLEFETQQKMLCNIIITYTKYFSQVLSSFSAKFFQQLNLQGRGEVV